MSTNAGGFKQGHRKLGGRARGTPNKFKAPNQRVMLRAAHLVGSDLNGKDGLIGYFEWILVNHPLGFLELAPGIIRMEGGPQPLVAPLTKREQLQDLEAWLGPLEDDENDASELNPESLYSWTGRGDPLGPLMHMAVASPVAFCKLLAATLPPMRGRTRRRSAALRPWV